MTDKSEKVSNWKKFTETWVNSEILVAITLCAVLFFLFFPTASAFMAGFIVFFFSFNHFYHLESIGRKPNITEVILFGVVFATLVVTFIFKDFYSGASSANGLYRVEDEMRILGTIGDFFGGSLGAIFGFLSLIAILRESHKARIREEESDKREEKREILEINRILTEMFLKRVEGAIEQLSNLNWSGYGVVAKGIEAIRNYSLHYSKSSPWKVDIFSYLKTLNDLIDETYSDRAMMIQSQGLDINLVKLRNYKVKVLGRLTTLEYLETYWQAIMREPERVKDLSYVVALYLQSLKTQRESDDFMDEDYLELRIHSKNLSITNTPIEYVTINQTK